MLLEGWVGAAMPHELIQVWLGLHRQSWPTHLAKTWRCGSAGTRKNQQLPWLFQVYAASMKQGQYQVG